MTHSSVPVDVQIKPNWGGDDYIPPIKNVTCSYRMKTNSGIDYDYDYDYTP